MDRLCIVKERVLHILCGENSTFETVYVFMDSKFELEKFGRSVLSSSSCVRFSDFSIGVINQCVTYLLVCVDCWLIW